VASKLLGVNILFFKGIGKGLMLKSLFFVFFQLQIIQMKNYFPFLLVISLLIVGCKKIIPDLVVLVAMEVEHPQ
jgi:hypothetical protein